jgi:putative phage-type endonuclease
MRHGCVTSTEASGIMGMSPYATMFELKHQKQAEKPPVFNSNERMKWGNRLEDSIAAAVAEEKGWKVEPLKDYCILPQYRMGSSFDYKVTEPEEAILEIKNVDGLVFNRSWVSDADGATEAPPHIEIQLQYQMLVSGMKKGYIAALVGGNELHIIEREAIREIHVKLFKKIKRFWEIVDNDEELAPNFVKDAEFIAQLYKYAHPGKMAEPTPRIDAIVSQWHDLKREEKRITTSLKEMKAELLTLIDDAEKLKGDGYSISAGVVGPSEVAYTRDGYRNFRITYKKDYRDES